MTKVQRTALGAAAAFGLLLGVVPLLAERSTGEVGAQAGARGLAPAQGIPPVIKMGDAVRGKALVESSGCLDCHRLDDRGSYLGPYLSGIGSRRTPDKLEQALVAPDDEVLVENRFVRFVTREGATVTGRVINQDVISVQLMTPKNELKSYLRAGLREYVILDKGLMPSVRGKLTDPQVADIVGYLSSLKEN